MSAAAASPRPGGSGVPSPSELVDDAVRLARAWAEAGERAGERAAAGRLARLVASPAGLDLAVRFIDRVVRPEDRQVAARELAALGAAPGAALAFLGRVDRALLRLGGALAPNLPWPVVPLARRRVRALVGHLVVDGEEPGLTRRLAALREPGVRLNLNLLGEAVLGEAEASRRASRVRDLLARPDVDHVSVKVSALVPQLGAWDVADGVARVRERLLPILRAAAGRTPPAFVTLDMEEYRDLDLTVAAFTSALTEPDLLRLEAGIALQAYLPDSVHAFEQVLAVALERRSRGGARLKVRLVKGANLAMERVEAELHGWVPAPYATKAEVDAAYVRLLDVALRPEVTQALRVGVASHNLYDVALAHLLARARGVGEAVEVEMLHGMAPGVARAVLAEVGSLVLYTPVVRRSDFDVAVSYLVRRLEENAARENFLRAVLAGEGRSPRSGQARSAALADQEARFRRSVADLCRVNTQPRRGRLATQNRPDQVPAFRNAPDADPSQPDVRDRVRRALAGDRPEPATPVLRDVAAADAVVARALRLSGSWSHLPGAARAAVLKDAARRIDARRDELWAVLAHEGGKPVGEADPEVSEAVDYAAYYAERAAELDGVDGARFLPAPVTVVTPPWNFPVAIPIGSALAALAAGSAVVLKPAPQTPLAAEVVAHPVREALAAAGYSPELLQVVRSDEGAVGRRLVSHPDVSTVILTGSIETARLFASWRPDQRLLAETSGKNAVVVTPAADADLAVGDLVRSAFGHAGQKCSAGSLAILVGSAATSRRLRRQLIDAVASVRVGPAESAATMMGPLIEPASGKVLRALTTLDPGEEWLVEPRRLDDSGRLWSPGVKAGVRPGSFFHLTECFAPVLGLMSAATLAEAVRVQNGTPFGLTGGLHSLDDTEIAYWLEHVEVGNAYVNRHITGAVVRRQPFGGWKASSVGSGAKAGGPHYVAQIGHWVPAGLPSRLGEVSPAVRDRLAALRALVDPSEEGLAWLEHAAGSDAHAWATELRPSDPSALASESNVLRYRPVPVLWIRADTGGRWVEVVRLALAATLAAVPVRVSVSPDLRGQLPADGATAAALAALPAVVQSAEQFAAALSQRARTAAPPRVRLVGDPASLALPPDAAAVTVVTGPVLAAGGREMLSVLREQAVSRTLHRFGQLPPGARRPPA